MLKGINEALAFYTGTAAIELTVLVQALNERSRRQDLGAPNAAHTGLLWLTASAGLSFLVLAVSLLAMISGWHPDALSLGVAVATITSAAALAGPQLGLNTGRLRRTLSHERRRTWVLVSLLLPVVFGSGLLAALLLNGRASSDDAYTKFRPRSFYVAGTCVNRACGLNRRVAPRLSAASRGELVPEGAAVDALCQAYGGLVTSVGHRRSRLWDLLRDRTWVSDLFLSTSKNGPRSLDLPRCPTGSVA